MTSPDPLTQLSSRLAMARRAARLTVRQAAERAGVHHTSIVRYEQGHLPKLDHLIALTKAYHLSLPALLVTDPDMVQLLTLLQDANPKQIAQCMQILEAAER